MVTRTFPQFHALYQKLVEAHKSEIIPVVPQMPTPQSMTDKEYLEKKRRQLDRCLVRMASRPSIVQSEDFTNFITSATVRPVMPDFRALTRPTAFERCAREEEAFQPCGLSQDRARYPRLQAHHVP